MTRMMCFTTTLLMTFSARAVLHAQGTLADYQRAHDLQAKVRDLVIHSPGPMSWIGDTHHFWYAHTVKGGAEYMLVNADAGEKKLAFDHAKFVRPGIFAEAGLRRLFEWPQSKTLCASQSFRVQIAAALLFESDTEDLIVMLATYGGLADNRTKARNKQNLDIPDLLHIIASLG